jgi:hypothetical protein
VTRILAALLFALVLTACTSSSGPNLPEYDYVVPLGEEFGLRVGDTAAFQTSQAIDLIRFNGVSQDSRCPVDVQCVTAGSATVLLSVQTALSSHDITLDVPPEGTVEVVVDEITVTATRLLPNAREGQTIDPLDYIVGLMVVESSVTPISP